MLFILFEAGVKDSIDYLIVYYKKYYNKKFLIINLNIS